MSDDTAPADPNAPLFERLVNAVAFRTVLRGFQESDLPVLVHVRLLELLEVIENELDALQEEIRTLKVPASAADADDT